MQIYSPIAQDSLVVSGSMNVSGSVTAQSFTGSFSGTASYAANALTSSYALTASVALNVPATASYAVTALTASYANFAVNTTSASFAVSAAFASQASTAVSASFATNAGTAGSASFATNASTAASASHAVSASYATASAFANNSTSASYALSASFAVASSTAVSASFATNAANASSASYALNSSNTVSASFARSASYAMSASYATASSFATTASYAVFAATATTASFATNASTAASASFATNAGTAGSASYAVSASYATASSFASSASYALNASNAVTASHALNSVSASYALFAANSTSASYALSASYAFNSSVAISASFATNAGFAGSSSYAQQANTASSADNFTVRGTLTATNIVVQTITSSQSTITGSTRFGSIITNTHQFTGSVLVTGSITVIDGVTNNLTASWANRAISSSFAANASTAASASFATSAANATTASHALQAVTASFALNSQNAFVQGGNSFGAQALLGTNDLQNLAFETNGTVRMVISGSTGNIGIGTTNTLARLTISTKVANAASPYAAGDSYIALTNTAHSNIGSLMIADNGNTWLNAAGGTTLWLNWYAANAASSRSDLRVGDGFGGLDILSVVGSTRRVGINSTSPAYNLDVKGNAYISASSAGNPLYVAGGVSGWVIFSRSGKELYLNANYGDANQTAQISPAATSNMGLSLSSREIEEDLYITGSTGFVGIGTKTPAFPLNIYGSFAATVYQTPGTGTGAGNGFYVGHSANISYVWNYNNFPLVLAVNNAEVMRITGSSVGIGTINPTARLDIAGDSNGNSFRVYSSNASGPAVAIHNTGTGGKNWQLISNGSSNTDGAGRLQYWNSTDFFTAMTLGFSSTTRTNLYTPLYIAGNVGIGMTSPNQQLVVSGSGSDTRIEIGSTTTQGIYFTKNGVDNGTFRVNTNGDYEFYTKNVSQAVVITAGGNVGIGTTSPTSLLSLSKSSLVDFQFNASDQATDEKNWIWQAGSAVGTGVYRLRAVNDAYTNGINAIIFTRSGISSITTTFTGGSVGIGTTAPVTRLQISGVNNDLHGQLRILATGTGADAQISFETPLNGRGIYVDDSDTNKMKFYTGNGKGAGDMVTFDNSGNVGIGTTAPSAGYRMEIAGDLLLSTTSGNRSVVLTTSNANAALNTISGDGLELASDGSNRNLAFRTGTTTAMRIISNGNVGINQTNPRVKLTIDAGNVSGVAELINLHNQSITDLNGTSLTFSGYQATSTYPTWRFSGIKGLYDGNSGGLNAGGWGGQLRFFVNRGGAADQFEDVMTITGGSRVGIGTTSPYTKLSIVQDITTTAEFGSFGQFTLQGATNPNKLLSFGFNTSTDVGFIQAMVNGTSYNNLLLNARGGNVGIGTTSPGVTLDVSGSGIRILNSSAPNFYLNNTTVQWKMYLTSAGSSNFAINDAVRDVLTLGYNGAASYFSGCNVGIGTTAPNALLHVAGTIHSFPSSTDGVLQVSQAGSSGGLTTAVIRSNGVSYFTGGSVGIGTTGAGTRLTVFTDASRIPASAAFAATNVAQLTLVGSDGGLEMFSQDDNTTWGHYLTMKRFNGSTGALIAGFGFSTFTNTGSPGSNTFDRMGIHYGTNAYPQDNTELMSIKSNGIVGIGTINPNIYGNGFNNQFTVSTTSGYANITVAGSSINGGGIDFGNQTVRQAGVYSLSGSHLGFYTNGSNSGNGLTERIRILSNGSVGIGTTIPSSSLHVVGPNGGADPYALIRINATGTYPNNIAGLAFDNSGVQQHIRFLKNGVERCQIRYNEGSNEDNKLKIYSWITGTDFVTFDANTGNVGIGTTSPSAKFNVNNSGGTGNAFYVDAGNSPNNQVLFEHSGANTPVPFTIRKSGYVGSSDNFGVLYIDMAHNVAAGGSNLHFTLRNSSGNTQEYGGLGAVISTNTAGGEAGALNFYTTNAGTTRQIRMRIAADGNVGIGTTAPNYKLRVQGDIYASADVIAYSDARAKDNVKTVENALAKVTSLRGVTYTRNDIEDKSTKMGVIAQEVLKVLPEVVREGTDGYYSVAYGNIVGVLIEAIKELKAEIDELKNNKQ